ncbi:hypothetical protein JDV02_009201 [Purpureocillium takamizusanense]|uniref:Uncharacterized protein n=1 Tax=Purpureocillium takamizusanense TaxID=2060973 RepID=A0A9Q8QRX8_9HYPO|nr:uncharacterized protein JDV02_009201 [Purpureocillium takamizusanense]UNI23377.1 hypothetical protein JDV02_009201 [Purpureocillium takamizusanense]
MAKSIFTATICCCPRTTSLILVRPLQRTLHGLPFHPPLDPLWRDNFTSIKEGLETCVCVGRLPACKPCRAPADVPDWSLSSLMSRQKQPPVVRPNVFVVQSKDTTQVLFPSRLPCAHVFEPARAAAAAGGMARCRPPARPRAVLPRAPRTSYHLEVART